MHTLSKLGPAIHAARLRARLSIDDVAVRIGRHKLYVTRLETGTKANPTYKLLLALGECFDEEFWISIGPFNSP